AAIMSIAIVRRKNAAIMSIAIVRRKNAAIMSIAIVRRKNAAIMSITIIVVSRINAMLTLGVICHGIGSLLNEKYFDTLIIKVLFLFPKDVSCQPHML
ncbi:hypothetical protein P4647_13350, partial [Peribacillus frigoritolerans]|uniref:hypothetical protein n=1 Tax=Peribacillus frigoritolerans TaxID=450367 RepID=UPI002E1F1ECD|nr:hypothetical protein [Peribacillus frigoritolerans]